MADLQVRFAELDDLPAFRALRLTALQDAPDAFETTYDDELARGEQPWRERWASRDNARRLAILDGEPVGIVGGYLADPGTVELVRITPAARGRGIGDALVDAVVQWAWRHSAKRVRAVGNRRQ